MGLYHNSVATLNLSVYTIAYVADL